MLVFIEKSVKIRAFLLLENLSHEEKQVISLLRLWGRQKTAKPGWAVLDCGRARGVHWGACRVGEPGQYPVGPSVGDGRAGGLVFLSPGLRLCSLSHSNSFIRFNSPVNFQSYPFTFEVSNNFQLNRQRSSGAR